MAEPDAVTGETPSELVRSRLSGARRSGSSYTCPTHADKNPSLSVSEGRDGRCLLYCHAGCQLAEILDALGLELRDLFPAGSGYQGSSHARPSRGPARRRLTKAEQVRQGLEAWRERRVREINGELREIEDRLRCLTELFMATITLLRHGCAAPDTSGWLREFDELRSRESELEQRQTLLSSPGVVILLDLWHQENPA